MNIIWTLLGTMLLFALAVGCVIVFEVTTSPSSDQRGKVGTVAFIAFASISLGLWVWHFTAKKGGKK